MVTVEGAGHIVRYVNPAFCRLMDKPTEQLVGKPFCEKMMPEKNECLALLDRVYRTGKPESHTESRPAGIFWSYTMWPVMADERPVGVMVQVTETAKFHEQTVAMNEALLLGAVRQHELTEAAESLNAQLQVEITERKQAEERLRRNEALFSALTEQAPVGVYVVDGQLRLQQINPRARSAFNQVHPLIGQDISEILRVLWPRRVADQFVRRFQHTLKTGAPYQSLDFAERRRDIGVKEFYEWQVQRVTLPAGEYGVACFFNNITERKRAERTQRRMDVLTASNRKLNQEIVRRQAVEEALRKSAQYSRQLLEQSRHMQEQLRLLSRQVLSAQEEERKKISRELHDVVAQTLTSINVRLANLKKEAMSNTKGLDRNIARTQRLVERSVDIVHRFARELRPTVLDDLGLIPALHTFMKGFRRQTGIRVSLSAFAAVEKMNGDKRTALYRLAQEALTNVARHAHASQAEVKIQKLEGTICMKIKDNGKGFPVKRVLLAKKGERLGLLGMRERLEMVGGILTVTSAPGKGTTILAQIPLLDRPPGGAPR